MTTMPKGYAAIKAKSDEAEKDKFFMKNVTYYCKGRGCRHKGVPELKPTAVCFYIKGSNCSHKEVCDRIEDVLPLYPGAKIEEVQFVPLGVHLDSIVTENRWIITLNSVGARNRIAGTSLHIKGQKITLRRYDDIIQLEFRKCSRSGAVKDMVSKIKQLNTGTE
ncbi:uncharacterized protein LOC132758579 [Ruditapes philippinarum]|uniref:uncharacterized protein LOC132758579 n=1 Tax=Ruditapes philippinarum TaxID=129788 RepID=UPI00295AABDC|nr:uncharacterized protein LOC132758579 [Ruditapes philippinarum]